MKKVIILITILVAFSSNANAVPNLWKWMKSASKMGLGYKASMGRFVDKSKMLKIYKDRKEEFYAIPANAGKKFPKKKEWIKGIGNTSMAFLKKPSLAVWYKTGSSLKRRYIARNSKTGLTIVYNSEFRVVTTYFSSSKKIKNRLKKGTLIFKKRGEVKRLIKNLKAREWLERLAREDALVVNFGLFF